MLADGLYEVIDCGRRFTVHMKDDLQPDPLYRGYNTRGSNGSVRRVAMPTLRRLKQMASYYNRKVWKKFRDGDPYHSLGGHGWPWKGDPKKFPLGPRSIHRGQFASPVDGTSHQPDFE